ncbi:putative esterase C31F10.02 isoform X1 [Hevea brasiliensis]|uniref:putative esterase C31F10.02 isoform X1 n=1 Tax=Hevea brasiliensis TaxID=3981 RepID=UPI0025D92CBA|nr:putative esterase C31F10.02 isoform X1 [Hevea brasiliensis]
MKDGEGGDFLQLSQEESESVLTFTLHPHRPRVQRSFFDDFASRGLLVDQIEPGFISCSFIVTPRLIDRNGNYANGAIAALIDMVSGAAIPVVGGAVNVSVDMSISFLFTAKVNDEIEISARGLGQKGRYFGTYTLVRNKATQEIIAEARHSLFDTRPIKM